MDENRRASGVVLVIVSAVVFSTAGIFTKGVVTGSWGIIFWRGLAAAGFTVTYLALSGKLMQEIRAFRGPAILVAVLGASGTIAFIPAFKLTSVANVALIYAAAPFMAAGLAWLFVGERPSRVVVLSSVVAFGGVLVIFAGSLGGGGLVGDMLALWMTLMIAAIMVVYRRWPDTTAALPAAVSSLVLLPVAVLFADPLDVSGGELAILVAFGLVFAVASVTLSEGARRLPSAETALLSALEVPFAPLWAFLILAERPALATVVGGTVVFLAVLGAQIWQGKGR